MPLMGVTHVIHIECRPGRCACSGSPGSWVALALFPWPEKDNAVTGSRPPPKSSLADNAARLALTRATRLCVAPKGFATVQKYRPRSANCTFTSVNVELVA